MKTPYNPAWGGGRLSPRDMAASSALPAPHWEAWLLLQGCKRSFTVAGCWKQRCAHGSHRQRSMDVRAAGRDGSQARNPALCAQPSLHCRGELLPTLDLKL